MAYQVDGIRVLPDPQNGTFLVQLADGNGILLPHRAMLQKLWTTGNSGLELCSQICASNRSQAQQAVYGTRFREAAADQIVNPERFVVTTTKDRTGLVWKNYFLTVGEDVHWIPSPSLLEKLWSDATHGRPWNGESVSPSRFMSCALDDHPRQQLEILLTELETARQAA